MTFLTEAMNESHDSSSSFELAPISTKKSARSEWGLTTPQKLKLLLALIWLGCLFCAVAGNATENMGQALSNIIGYEIPSIIAMQNVRSSISKMRTTAVNEFLAPTAALRAIAREQYENSLKAATNEMIAASQRSLAFASSAPEQGNARCNNANAAIPTTIGAQLSSANKTLSMKEAGETAVRAAFHALHRYIASLSTARALQFNNQRATTEIIQSHEWLDAQLLAPLKRFDGEQLRLLRQHCDQCISLVAKQSELLCYTHLTLMIIVLFSQWYLRKKTRRILNPILLVTTFLLTASLLLSIQYLAREQKYFGLLKDAFIPSLEAISETRSLLNDITGLQSMLLLQQSERSSQADRIDAILSDDQTTRLKCTHDSSESKSSDTNETAAERVDNERSVNSVLEALSKLREANTFLRSQPHETALNSYFTSILANSNKLDDELASLRNVETRRCQMMAARCEELATYTQYSPLIVAVMVALGAWLAMRPRLREYGG